MTTHNPIALPALAYGYDELEPHLDTATMTLHHSKHHQSYVDNYNKALERLQAAKHAGDFSAIKPIIKDMAFNGAGHYLHVLFWQNMAPERLRTPASDALLAAIDAQWGSYEAFKKAFIAAGTAVEGSGWVIAGIDMAGNLSIMQAEKHQDIWGMGLQPVLVCDVWEHSYYLKFQNRRADYLESFWQVINWGDVSAKYAAAVVK